MGVGSVSEWQSFSKVVNLLFQAYGMDISEKKSYFFKNGINPTSLSIIKTFLSFRVNHLDKGFQYLGFYLKPNYYQKEDWCGCSGKLKIVLVCGAIIGFLWEEE